MNEIQFNEIIQAAVNAHNATQELKSQENKPKFKENKQEILALLTQKSEIKTKLKALDSPSNVVASYQEEIKSYESKKEEANKHLGFDPNLLKQTLNEHDSQINMFRSLIDREIEKNNETQLQLSEQLKKIEQKIKQIAEKDTSSFKSSKSADEYKKDYTEKMSVAFLEKNTGLPESTAELVSNHIYDGAQKSKDFLDAITCEVNKILETNFTFSPSSTQTLTQ